MTSKLTREETVQAVFDLKAGYTLGLADVEILKRVARMTLAAMDSEPNRNPVLAYADSYRDMAKQGVESVPIWSVITDLERNIAPLYRHAQQPVVPDDVLGALQKVARIRLDLNDFDGDRRGIADCLGDAEEALIEIVNRRAAMLQELQKSAGASNNCRSNEKVQAVEVQSVPGIKPAPALGSLPKIGEVLPTNSPVIGIDPASGPGRTVEVRYVAPPGYVMVPKEPTKEMIDAGWLHYMATKNPSSKGTYKAMLAAAPQEEPDGK